MKRIVVLVVVLTLSFIFVACNNGAKKDEKEQAVKEVVNETPPDWFSDIFGDWELIKREKDTDFKVLTIREDNIAFLDDKTLSWKFDYTDEVLSFYEEEKNIGTFSFDILENGEMFGTINIKSLGYINNTLLKPTAYDIITFTTDNLNNYFEIKGDMNYRENAFGEVESGFYEYNLCFKEEYYERLSQIYTYINLEGAIEYSYDEGDRKVAIDKDKRTYTLGAFASGGKQSGVSEFTLLVGDTYPEPKLYAWLANNNWGQLEMENGQIYSWDDNFVVTRVQLTLYLIKK